MLDGVGVPLFQSGDNNTGSQTGLARLVSIVVFNDFQKSKHEDKIIADLVN